MIPAKNLQLPVVAIGSLAIWISTTFALAQEGAIAAKIASFPTVAEQSDFTATATGAQVELFLRRLASQWPEAELTMLGRSVEGRALWGLVVNPKTRTDAKPLTILMLGGIHSGECDGKEALLSLARDLAWGWEGVASADSTPEKPLATDPNGKLWWQSLRLIFVPNFNADGNERRGKLHRPHQMGPSEGVGIRENAQRLDLNCDFIKLESPEVRSLVAALNEYDVDVLIDTHTTSHSLHRYELTYDIPHNPAMPHPIDAWLRTELLPEVTERLDASGIATFFCGEFDADHRKWSSHGHEPRSSAEYMALRGRIGVLAESYSHASYESRVRASYAFVKEILHALSDDAPTIRQLLDNAASRPPPLLPIQAELAMSEDQVVVKGYEGDDGSLRSPAHGTESSAQDEMKDFKDYSVQLWNRAVGTKHVPLPAAYAIPEQYAWAVSRLICQGVQVKRLEQSIPAQCAKYRFTKVRKNRPFQGHRLLSVEVEASERIVELRRGSYVVETAQPLGFLAAYLLEPESDDSLARWNFFDPDIVANETYPVIRVMANLPLDVTKAIESVEANEQITLDRLMQPGRMVDYSGDRTSDTRWLKKSSEYVIQEEIGTYLAVDAATGARRPLDELDLLRRKLAALNAFSDEEAKSAARIGNLSDDGMHGLVSHKQDLYFFDARAAVVRQLTHSPNAVERLAEPNSSGSHVAFVRDNNLWVVDCETTELKQLTEDGSPELLNGVLDWVYQEELYGRGNFKAFWWSPDGAQIAYLQLDQTPVHHYRIPDNISVRQDLEDTRYPKAGDPLPIVRAWIVEVASGERREADLDAFTATDRLIARVKWSPAGELWLQIFNRVQNKQDIVKVNPHSGTAISLFTEVSLGWIEIRGTPEFLPDGDFLWISDLPGGRTHLFRVSATSGRKTQLTSGDWDVDSLVSVAADSKTAFVSGNISHPTENQLIAVDLESRTQRLITSAPGTNRFQVDDSGKYFIDVFSSLGSPFYTTLHSIDGQLIRVIDAPTSDRHEFLEIRPPQRLTITARDGLELQAMLMLPPDMAIDDPTRKLPVLFHVYGGPQAATVKNAWGGRNYWWHQFLCQQGIAVLLCDNRSALGRGIRDTWTIRGDMGRVELRDVEDAARWVSEQDWAAPERIGLWGWSYGGYLTTYAMTHSQLFKAGIAGAPVTDWRNYDAIYTERYMDLPQNNAEGYESSSSVEAAEHLHGRLLIIHGERDDNVHISNSLQLAYALQKAGKLFDLMIYPKNRHSIDEAEQRFHLYKLMTEFLHEWL